MQPSYTDQKPPLIQPSIRRRVIFLFLDGVGLGIDDAEINPLVVGIYPELQNLLLNSKPIMATRKSFPQAELIPTDAQMGVPGRPQSATGQAAILTGINAPQRLGEHYGPRPDARVRAILDEASIFRQLHDMGLQGYFCNAYPPSFFEAVQRGKRLLSAVPYAATVGGQKLLTHTELYAGQALAADFTNAGWRTHLNYPDAPVYTPEQAGERLWKIAQPYDFVFFEHWLTDLLGHRCQLEAAVENFQIFDRFLSGLLSVTDLEHTLIIVGSDHGNVEDCSHRKHTENPALTILLGAERQKYAPQIERLNDFVPVIMDFLTTK